MAKCHREHVSTTAMTTMRVSTVTMIMGMLMQLLVVAGLHGVLTALEIDQWTTMSGASGSMREMKASIAIEMIVVIVDGIGIVVMIVFGGRDLTAAARSRGAARQTTIPADGRLSATAAAPHAAAAAIMTAIPRAPRVRCATFMSAKENLA